MDQPKPIKRSKELTPLSKEHHEGLLFGWKIKQGLRKGTDYNTLAAFVKWFWENDLEEHFRKEEEVLAPQLPMNTELVKRMFAEHKEIEKLVRSVDENTGEEGFLNLAGLIHDHIRFEERELFPFAEKFIPQEKLGKIYVELAGQREKNVWEDEFWLRK